MKTGHIEDAKVTFQEALQRCPQSVHILHAWGHFEQKYGALEVARDCWSKAMEIEPLNAYVGHALCLLELRLGNHQRARDILWDLVKKKPTAALCVTLSEQERKRGQVELAREILLDALHTCGQERSKIYLALAWLEENIFHNIGLALEYISEGMKADGYDNVRAYVAKASLELRCNQLELAKATLENATKMQAEDGQHYTMWSTIELESGNVDKARSIIEEGARRYPGDQFLLQRWGSFEAKHGNSSVARKLFEKSVVIQPHTPTFVAWATLEEAEGVAALAEARDWEHRSFLQSLRLVADKGSSSSSNTKELVARPDEPVRSSSQAAAFAESQFSLARNLFMIGMEINPLHGPLYHAYGNMELRRGNYTGAKAVFRRGVCSNCSDSASLFHALGLLEIKLSRVQHARDILQTGISSALRIDGMEQMKQGDGSSFESLLQRINSNQHIQSEPLPQPPVDTAQPSIPMNNSHNYELHSGVSYLLHTLGMLEYDQYRYDVAEQIFRAGSALYPQHTQILLGLALVYAKLADSKQARKYFKASIAANALHLHAWQAWAVFEKSLQNFELARALFKEGLRHGPSHGALWQGYAVMEMQLGNLEVARSLFMEAIARCPSHAQSYQAWACLELKAGNLSAAYRLVYEGMRRCGHVHPALWTIAAVAEERMGDRSRAKRLLVKAIERFPRHGALYKVLGELELKEGDVAKAREHFLLGLERDPYYAATYHVAALLEARLGNLEVLYATTSFLVTL